MKSFLHITAFLAIMALFTGCFRNDRRTGEFHVPMMQTPECLSYLSGKLGVAEGVEHVTADFATQKVIVTFNGLKLALKNIEIIIAEAGFDVNERPASPSAKASMPAPCR